MKKRYPTTDEAWELLVERATAAMENRTPVYTLQRGVRNFIADVNPKSVGRTSDDGTTNRSRATKGDFKKIWEALLENGTTTAPDNILYFSMALVPFCLPDYVEHVELGRLALREAPQTKAWKERSVAEAEAKSGRGKWGKGGEGPLHKAIKEFVYEEPDQALSTIEGAPFAPVGMEYPLGTDSVDVVLMDCEGRIVLVEVKPFIEAGDRWPFAQAAKYRTLWSVLYDVPAERIRCVVVCPEIPSSPAKKMKQLGIESAIVSLSPERIPPKC